MANPMQTLSPIRTKVVRDPSQSRRSQSLKRAPDSDSFMIRDSAASLEPTGVVTSPQQPRSLHRPTPIPSGISTRQSGTSIQSLPSIKDEDDLDAAAIPVLQERMLQRHALATGPGSLSSISNDGLHDARQELAGLARPQDQAALTNPVLESGALEETLLGPSHRGSSFNMDSEVVVPTENPMHHLGPLTASGSFTRDIRTPNGSVAAHRGGSGGASRVGSFDRKLSDSATDREHLPVAVQRAISQMGSDAATPVRTASGTIEHLVEVGVDLSPQEAATAVTNPLHSQRSIPRPREVTERDLRAVARFLRLSPGLGRKVIGDLLGENCERCKRLLLVYASTFEFQGKTFEASLREYLEAFRLPGESQKIDRILEAFSARFWNQTLHSTLFRSADAVHVLAFSAVLLNTDLHNSTVKKKMTLEHFIRNNRGINDNEDFPPEFLEELYNSIACKGFRIPPPPQDLMGSNASTRKAPSRPTATQKALLQKKQGKEATWHCWPFSSCFG